LRDIEKELALPSPSTSSKLHIRATEKATLSSQQIAAKLLEWSLNLDWAVDMFQVSEHDGDIGRDAKKCYRWRDISRVDWKT